MVRGACDVANVSGGGAAAASAARGRVAIGDDAATAGAGHGARAVLDGRRRVVCDLAPIVPRKPLEASVARLLEGTVGKAARVDAGDERGVGREATPTESKIAFRAGAKATRTDAEGGDVTGEAFRRACAAHEVLMDDARRMMIDDGIVDRAGGFEWVEGEIRTTLDGARRSAKTTKTKTKKKKKKRTETAKKATPWDEKVMPSPENRESILRAWYFRRFQAYWRRWCEVWLGFLSVGAPLGVAAAGFYAAGFIDVDVDIDTVVAHLRAHDLSTFLSSLDR